MENNEKKITVYDSEGNEHLMELLFTYDNEQRGTSYVFFFDPSTPDDILVMRYNENNELEDIDDEEEYAEVEEVFAAYEEDPKIQDLKK